MDIWARVGATVDPPDALLDVGAGRGWLLERARAAGARHVAGADTSAIAVQGLRDRGIEALLIVGSPYRA
jgi:2-polyprenyl-3-methyl-5-hydroxy-6-metoxy-1,4-benzoquinol methylase